MRRKWAREGERGPEAVGFSSLSPQGEEGSRRRVVVHLRSEAFEVQWSTLGPETQGGRGGLRIAAQDTEAGELFRREKIQDKCIDLWNNKVLVPGPNDQHLSIVFPPVTRLHV